jgi:hypothetical protein
MSAGSRLGPHSVAPVQAASAMDLDGPGAPQQMSPRAEKLIELENKLQVWAAGCSRLLLGWQRVDSAAPDTEGERGGAC